MLKAPRRNVKPTKTCEVRCADFATSSSAMSQKVSDAVIPDARLAVPLVYLIPHAFHLSTSVNIRSRSAKGSSKNTSLIIICDFTQAAFSPPSID